MTAWKPSDRLPLAEQHRDLLEASEISDEVAAERGYWTATRKAELETLGFKRVQCSVPALVIPIRDAAGRIVNYQIRPDQPRIGGDGRPVKYESPAAVPPTLDVPPRCRRELDRPHFPLWITEGARKADAGATAGLCCVSLPGVWSWARRLNGDAREVLPDLQRVRFEDRQVIVAFDSDAMVKPTVYRALVALTEYLKSRGAPVRFCYLPEIERGVKSGLDDFLRARRVEELWEYVADELREPVGPAKEEREPTFHTAHLLGFVDTLLSRYVHFPAGDGRERVALALYVLHTWAPGSVTPYLYVRSPQKRSGKTRLLEVLELVCRHPLRAASITEAAIFQAVEALAPTLLIDEVDAIFTARSERAEALRGVLNAGNRRGAVVVRGTAEGEPATFDTFCPKVLAGIDTGKLPDTIRDRAVVIDMERKLRSERVERFRVEDLGDQPEQLRQMLDDWAAEHRETLASYRCEPLPEISDRLEEAWEPLFAIAELAGEPWPQQARAAAVALAGVDEPAEEHGQLLLAALTRIFDEAEAMSTRDICAALNDDEELPFGAYRRGEGIDGRGLSRLLRPHGIRPRNVTVDGAQAKGYGQEQLTDAWARYVPEDAPARAAEDDPSYPSIRPAGPENGSGEPNPARTDSGDLSVRRPSRTDSGHLSVRHPSGSSTPSQSQNGASADGWTDRTDELRPAARAHKAASGEEAVLAACQALVDGGEATWVVPERSPCWCGPSREREWVGDGGRLICGKCHPPARADDVEWSGGAS